MLYIEYLINTSIHYLLSMTIWLILVLIEERINHCCDFMTENRYSECSNKFLI